MSLLLSLVLSGAPACFVSEPATPAGLLLAEKRWVAALETRDVPALECRLAPGFADSNWRGDLVQRTAILAALPNRPPSKLALTELRAEMYGDVGIVRGVNTQTGPAGKPIGRVRFTDVFVHRNGRWQAVSAQETPIRAD